MSYLGNSPQTVTTVDYIYLATAGQTVFTGNDIDGKLLAFTIGSVDVFVNGNLLTKQDCVETTGVITLNNPRDLNDDVLIRAKGTYSNTDHYTKAESVPAAGGAFTGDVSLVSMNGAGLHSNFRNKIIDGNFDLWNQATSQTSTGYGSSDMWKHDHAGSTKTTSRQAFTLGQTDVPGNPEYYCRTVVTSVAGAGNFAIAYQRIEDVKTLSGKTATLTFWAKADSAKNIAVELTQGFGTGGSPSALVSGISSQLVALTTSWQKFSVTIAIPSVSGKTLGSGGNDYLQSAFWFDSGSDWNTRTDSLGQQSGTFDIARVSLVEGDATAEDDPFPVYDKAIEAIRVCRYYEIMLGQIDTGANGSGTAYATWFYKVKKRAVPSISQTGSGISSTNSVTINSAQWFSTPGAALRITTAIADARL